MTRPAQTLKKHLLRKGSCGAQPSRRWLLPASLASFTLAGCASQGPLRPPSLYIPAQARGLVANRSGNAVDLHWTAPTRTTDGLPLSGKHFPAPLQAEICREEVAVSGCVPLGHVAAAGAPDGKFHDVLPRTLAGGSPRTLIYRVRMLNGNGKGAAPVAAEALAGAAPAALQNVEAAPAENGVLLRWQPVPGMGDGRILLRVTRGDTADRAAHAKQVQPGSQPTKSVEALLSVEVKGEEPAGTLDTGAKPGTAQHYSLVREQTVRIGGKDLSMSGPPVTVEVAADAKLPEAAPPTGLEAIANTLGPPEIDLVWQPATAATGYLIFRREASEAVLLLTREPVQSLTYSDTAVRPGARYWYSVSSMGRDGTAGHRSNEVEQGVPGR